VTDPYNIKPLIFGSIAIPTESKNANTDNTSNETASVEDDSNSVTGGFQLSTQQKQALIEFGVDPATVPSSISPTQETCFVSVLGEARVSEIKAGAVPSAIEFLRAKSCVI